MLFIQTQQILSSERQLLVWIAAIYRRFISASRELIPGEESDNELSHSKFSKSFITKELFADIEAKPLSLNSFLFLDETIPLTYERYC